MKRLPRKWRYALIVLFLIAVTAGELNFHHRSDHIKRAEAAIFLSEVFESHFGEIDYIVRRKSSGSSRSLALGSPEVFGWLRFYVVGNTSDGDLTLHWVYRSDVDRWEVFKALVNGKTLGGQFPIEVTNEMVYLVESLARQDQWWPSHRRSMAAITEIDRRHVGSTVESTDDISTKHSMAMDVVLVFVVITIQAIVGVVLVFTPIPTIFRWLEVLGIPVPQSTTKAHGFYVFVIRMIGFMACVAVLMFAFLYFWKATQTP